MDPLARTVITPELLKLVAEIDEFKGRWEALGNLVPERLSALKRIATIESVGSSTRIEGVKLRNDEIEKLQITSDSKADIAKRKKVRTKYGCQRRLRDLAQDVLALSPRFVWRRSLF